MKNHLKYHNWSRETHKNDFIFHNRQRETHKKWLYFTIDQEKHTQNDFISHIWQGAAMKN